MTAGRPWLTSYSCTAAGADATARRSEFGAKAAAVTALPLLCTTSTGSDQVKLAVTCNGCIAVSADMPWHATCSEGEESRQHRTLTSIHRGDSSGMEVVCAADETLS